MQLASDFPQPTREQWLALVDGVLKGAPFTRLVASTYDGIDVQPLYTAVDAVDTWPGQAPYQRGSTPLGATVSGWDVRQLHAGSDAPATNRAALADLANGVTSLWLRIGDGALRLADLGRALDGVYLELAPIVLSAGSQAVAAADALESLWRKQGLADSQARAVLGLDPINGAATMADAVRIASNVSTLSPGIRSLTVDGTAIHRCGASDVEELACVIAIGTEYLRALAGAGLSIDAAADQIEFRIAATTEQFSTIAKLRAARRLWSEVVTTSGGRTSMRQHAVTSSAMMTKRDPWVNLLRTTVACFAAAVGGADAITVLPFDHAIGLPDDFSRRIARNTQALLVDESNLGRVIDPGGGSWYLENLTNQMADRAWAWFQDIERAGGYAKAGEDVDARIAETWAKRSKNLATRRDPITGVSEFPNIGEEVIARDPAPHTTEGVRYAAAFEALRDRADAAATRPKMFLANLGPIAVHSARAGFAKNFFEVAGFETVSNDGFADEGQLATAFAASGAKQAVLCSSDKVYSERAAAAASALRQAGAVFVYLAGNPGDSRDAYTAAGIGDFIHIGSNALVSLGAALEREAI